MTLFERRHASTEDEAARLRAMYGWRLEESLVLANGVWHAPDRTAVDYPDEGHERIASVDRESFWYEHRAHVVDDLLRRGGVPPAPLWDVGAGSGAMTERLIALGHSVVPVEPSEVGAGVIARRGCGPALCSTLEALRLPTGSVPTIGFFDVVEHLADPIPVLREARRVLDDAGRLIVSVPAYQWLWSEEDDYSGHHRRYTRRRLCALLESANYRPLEVRYVFAALVLPALLIRALPYRLGIRREATGLLDSVSEALAPSIPVARVLRGVCRAERVLSRVVPIPLGLSVIATAEKAR